jgi:acyl-CoA synthetase (AMP-forming)/AMP-acid ligase II
LIVINSTPQEARVATMENARLLEIQIERVRERSLAGSICKGRVLRVLPGMQAAFVDIGLEKAAFLPGADFFPLAFALLKLGIIPIILDPAIGLKKLGECLNESQPDIFIGNAVTHLLRKLFGWGKASIKLNTSRSRGRWSGMTLTPSRPRSRRHSSACNHRITSR